MSVNVGQEQKNAKLSELTGQSFSGAHCPPLAPELFGMDDLPM